MTPEEYKGELERLARGHLDPDEAAVEFVKLRLRDGDKNLAKALRVEIDRLGLPEPWYHRWPDGVSHWADRHGGWIGIGFGFAAVAAVVVVFSCLPTRFEAERKQEAVEAGVAEWYWTPTGEKKFRLIAPPAKPEEVAEDAR